MSIYVHMSMPHAGPCPRTAICLLQRFTVLALTRMQNTNIHKKTPIYTEFLDMMSVKAW